MRRRAQHLLVAITCLVGMFAGSAAAYAASPTNLPGEGGTGWADCVYDTPAPSSSTVVVNYQYGIKLTCGSVVHIKAGHGFDDDTEACINNALGHLYYKETSKSNSANWVYSALWSAGGGELMEYYQVFVVVSKTTGVIQTAYTYAGDDSWYTCAHLKF